MSKSDNAKISYIYASDNAKIIHIDAFVSELDEELLEQYDVIFTKDGIYCKHGVTGRESLEDFVLFNK